MDAKKLALIDTLLSQMEKPARYIGGEMNTEVKPFDPQRVSFAFCFPDSYEVAMSHLGMKILYYIVNNEPDMLCERVFMPWTDMIAAMQAHQIPLFSLESRAALAGFDVVGFTLQYEMSYTNILAMLKLGSVSLLTKDRAEEEPIVIAGGPCAFNPEPLADFIDCFLIGDGERATVEMLRLIKEKRGAGAPRKEILRALAGIEGCYVPSLYEAQYHEDGRLRSFEPLEGAAPLPIKKRLELDLEDLPFPDKIPVPYTEVVHDRISLEIMRGCTRGCRFCQAGMLYRPVRERSPERLMALAEKLIKATGYDEMSLSSLSSGDYGKLAELVRGLMARHGQDRVSISLPSMRVDSAVKEELQQTSQVRKSGLTLAPEAGTQRLRDVINKGVTEEDLLRSVTDAFESGWSTVKLYFMIGLPTETDEDILGIADLARKVVAAYHQVPKDKRAPGLRITVSTATFVPKPFTPFQWAGQNSLSEIYRKQALLRDALKIKGVTYNWHDPEVSRLEACFARGDRRLGQVLLKAFERGCQLDGWREHFKYDEWLAAFEDCGLDPDFYAARERLEGEMLPWAFVDSGVTEKYLWLENQRAKQAVVTPDCREGCQGCGLTRFEGACVS